MWVFNLVAKDHFFEMRAAVLLTSVCIKSDGRSSVGLVKFATIAATASYAIIQNMRFLLFLLAC